MRKVETVVVPRWGTRDDGKTFILTEMFASKAEKWAWRLFLAVKGTTASVPEEIAALGMVAVAIRGLNSFLAADVKFELIEPLLDEMFECVKMIRDPRYPDVATALADDDIEEVQTRAWLRSEVLRLHTNFSLVDAALEWISATSRAAAMQNMQTSPQPSE